MSASLRLDDVPEETLRLLEQRARSGGRSVAEEHLALLQAALREPLHRSVDRSDLIQAAARLRAGMDPSIQTPSEDLIREDRDR